MNAALISNWNNVVSSDDHIFVVGDFFMGEKVLWPSHRAKLNGKITLVMGNHDVRGKKFTHEQDMEYMRDNCGIEEVVDEYYYKDEKSGLIYWMNHFPPDGYDRSSDERGYKRPEATQEYDVLVHGHTHQSHIFTGFTSNNKPIIHVGADAHNYTPVLFDKINDLYSQFVSTIKTSTNI